MIISASRRTDIPALYWDWFLNRLNAGFALSQNPMNAHQIRRVDLTEEGVDGFIFWTKNPIPMMGRLHALSDRPYYFQYTLNPYDASIEQNLPDKRDLIYAMQDMSAKIGKHRIIWRYDPILITDGCPVEWHEEQFERMCGQLAGAAHSCTISFLDDYVKIRKRIREIGARTPTDGERLRIADSFVKIAKAHGIRLTGCVDRIAGIEPGRCVDAEHLSAIAGYHIEAKKDANQRAGCTCAKSVDIGMYNCCLHGCAYCYANASDEAVKKRAAMHDSGAELLIGV